MASKSSSVWGSSETRQLPTSLSGMKWNQYEEMANPLKFSALVAYLSHAVYERYGKKEQVYNGARVDSIGHSAR